MKCENCGKYKAEVKDFRWHKGYENTVYVCRYCFNLNDFWFEEVRRRELDPKKVLEGDILEELIE